MEDEDRVDISPDKTAAEESGNEDDAIDPLVRAACQLELVEEPVDVVEWSGELVKNEDGGIVVDEGALKKKVSLLCVKSYPLVLRLF